MTLTTLEGNVGYFSQERRLNLSRKFCFWEDYLHV